MRLNFVHKSCPVALEEAVAASSCADGFADMVRPLVYHADCFVALRRCRASGDALVVKSYTKSKLSKLARQQVDNEMAIHASLEHPHVVQMLLVAEDDRYLHLIVQFADGGDLRRHLTRTALPTLGAELHLLNFIVRPLLQALAQLHSQGIVHRDLKPENVLVQQDSVRLADFGLSVYSGTSCTGHHTVSKHDASHAELSPKRVSPSVSDSSPASCCEHGSSSHSVTSAACVSCALSTSEGHAAQGSHDHPRQEEGSSSEWCGKCGLHHQASSPELFASAGGTPLYTAPEVLLAMFESRPMHDVVSHKNDVWALGVLAMEALTGRHPFSSPSSSPGPSRGFGGQGAYRGGGSGDNVLYTIAHCGEVHPPSWVSTSCAAFLRAALSPDPSHRPSAVELLSHPWVTGLDPQVTPMEPELEVSTAPVWVAVAGSAGAVDPSIHSVKAGPQQQGVPLFTSTPPSINCSHPSVATHPHVTPPSLSTKTQEGCETGSLLAGQSPSHHHSRPGSPMQQWASSPHTRSNSSGGGADGFLGGVDLAAHKGVPHRISLICRDHAMPSLARAEMWEL